MMNDEIILTLHPTLPSPERGGYISPLSGLSAEQEEEMPQAEGCYNLNIPFYICLSIIYNDDPQRRI
jgi:hypothetical protein